MHAHFCVIFVPDELIRESAIQCPERGCLLLRVRDEFRVTLDCHERLFESGVEYGGRKALEGEVERRGVEIQVREDTSYDERINVGLIVVMGAYMWFINNKKK